MRSMIILGALLLAAGLYVAINGASFTTNETVLKAGPLEANMKRQQTIPPWVGAVAILGGVGLIAVGFRKG